ATVLEGLVQGLELDGVPPHADTEAQPAAAQHVYLGRLLGHQGRLPLRQDQDAGREREPARDGREVRHQGERLMDDGLVGVGRQRRMRVELRVGAEDVIGHEEVVVAHRLDGLDERADGGDAGPALRLGKDHARLHVLSSFDRDLRSSGYRAASVDASGPSVAYTSTLSWRFFAVTSPCRISSSPAPTTASSTASA